MFWTILKVTNLFLSLWKCLGIFAKHCLFYTLMPVNSYSTILKYLFHKKELYFYLLLLRFHEILTIKKIQKKLNLTYILQDAASRGCLNKCNIVYHCMLWQLSCEKIGQNYTF